LIARMCCCDARYDQREYQRHRYSLHRYPRVAPVTDTRTGHITRQDMLLCGVSFRVVTKTGKLVWTDTWICRSGKWQIVSAEDDVVPTK